MKNLITWLMRNIPRPILIRFSLVFNKLAPVFFAGNNVECPVCNSHFRTFLPYGTVKRRDNVLCPKCLSLERHRLLWIFLNNKTDFFKADHRLLHIAPEQCFYKKFKSLPNIKYTTADLNSPIADVHMDIHSMPFEDESYDIVLCNHVLEHVDDSHKAMTEIFRVLKRGGWAVMQVPLDVTRATTLEDPTITSEKDREIHYWQKDHVRLFGLDYGDKLRAAGFIVAEIKASDIASEEKIKRYRLMDGEIVYLASKA